MSVMEAPSEEKLKLDNGEALCHARCVECYPDKYASDILTLCGMKYTHRGKDGAEKPKCVVCAELFNRVCTRCGPKRHLRGL